MKLINKFIGQTAAKETLNEILTAREYARKNKEPFIFPPLYFTGLSGVGKTELALKYVEALKDENFKFEEVPVKAGWRYFDQLAARVAEVPAVIFLDEAQEPSPIEEMLKLILNVKEPRTFTRNDTTFSANPSNHSWILASNEEIDPALKRRCVEVAFTTYTQDEKKQLLKIMCNKDLPAETVDYLEARTKPMAGDIDNLCKRLNLQPVDKISLKLAKTIVQNIGLFPQGLVKKDLELLMRMHRAGEKPTPIDNLKAVIGDVKTSATRGRLGWLAAIELAEIRKGGYALTKGGIAYLKNLQAEQAKMKAKK